MIRLSALALIFIYASAPSFAADTASAHFLIGAANTTCMSFQQADSGRTSPLRFSGSSGVYPKGIRVRGGQSNLDIEAIFPSGDSVMLTQQFKVGYNEQGLEKKTNKYCFGQFDFDKDGDPELVISVEDSDFQGMTGVSLNIFQYHPPLKSKDIKRGSNWEMIGALTAPDVLGDGKVLVKDGSVTIPRNIRSFYYEITWVKGRFIETSDY